MWHEARKQEKLIRGMIVDYRRRAERRKDFYEKIKAEPTQFLQLHGRPCKIHLDPAVAMAGEGPAIMMQWQGDPDNMIDRFDVRAHLDFIPEVKFPDVPVEDLSQEERQCNYERYRILAQNAFLGINEDKFLQQLAIEEQFGVTLEEKEMQKEKLHERKGTGAAIGYNYNDPGSQLASSNGSETKKTEKVEKIEKESDDDSDLDILDVDLSIDVNKMEPSQAHDLNAVGPQFGMAGCDLFSFLTGDADDAEHQKQLLREEKEKAMYSGRKSRRERRAHRDKKLATRVMSPPSYAAPAGPAERAPSPARSASRSLSPDGNDHIEFITEFGGEDDNKPPLPKKPSYSEKVKHNLKKLELYSEVTRKNKDRSETSEEYYHRPIGPRGPNSRSVSPTTISSDSPRFKSRSRSKSRSFSRSYSRSRSSRSRSSRSRSSRSRSRSRNNRSKRSRSPANNSAKRNRSRSNSFESYDRGAPMKAAVPRYYGRRKEDKSSSELSFESGSSDSEAPKKTSVGNRSNTNQDLLRSSGSGSKGSSHQAMSLKEKLKKKMQAQLARQLRADKRAEAERQERESRRQARRDEEMRDLAIKLRRKQREKRHKFRPSSEESDRSRSRSSSRDSGPPGTFDRVSRSRSISPERLPVSHDKEPPKPKPRTEDHPPYDRRRYQDQDYNQRNYYPENNLRSRSPSPHNNPPVWENPRQASYPSYPDSRRNRYEDDERQEQPRYENPRAHQRYDNRYEQHSEMRWDSRRRPYGHRGGYRGYNRPGPSGDNSWSRDTQDYRNDRSKVKLVDY